MNPSILSKVVRSLSTAAAIRLSPPSVVSAGPAQFVIVNVNAPGVGFNDPTPRAPVGGNTGTTLGQQRLIAFQYAASLWSGTLDSTVPIRIRAQFAALGANVLGSAGPIVRLRDFHQRAAGRDVVSRRAGEQAGGIRSVDGRGYGGARHRSGSQRRHRRQLQRRLRLLPRAGQQPRREERSRRRPAA